MRFLFDSRAVLDAAVHLVKHGGDLQRGHTKQQKAKQRYVQLFHVNSSTYRALVAVLPFLNEKEINIVQQKFLGPSPVDRPKKFENIGTYHVDKQNSNILLFLSCQGGLAKW